MQLLFLLAACTSVAFALDGYTLAASGTQTVNRHRFDSAFDNSALVAPEVLNSTEQSCADLCTSIYGCSGFFLWFDKNNVTRCRLLKYGDFTNRGLSITNTQSLSYSQEISHSTKLVAEGKNGPAIEKPVRFANAFDPESIIFKDTISTTECRVKCGEIWPCLGVFSYLLPGKNTWRCNGLKKITYTLVPTNLTGYSFAKIDLPLPAGFTLEAVGNNFNSVNLPTRYEEAFAPEHLVVQLIDIDIDTYVCANTCLGEPLCEGFHHYYQGGIWRCRLLKNLTGSFAKTSLPSYSLRKNTATCIPSPDITKCVDIDAFKNHLGVYSADSFDSLGAVGSTLTTFSSTPGRNLEATFSVTNCTDECLYVNPNKAISANESSTELVITFSSNVMAFGANIYTTTDTNDGDALVPGKWRIVCGDYSKTLFTVSNNSYFGASFPKPISSCTLVSFGGLFVTVDDLVIGYQVPCKMHDGITVCNDYEVFSNKVNVAVFDEFERIEAGTEINTYNMDKGLFSATVSSPNVQFKDKGVIITEGKEVASNWMGDELKITFSPGTRSFGAFIYSVDTRGKKWPNLRSIKCAYGDKNETFTTSISAAVANKDYFGAIFPADLSSCTVNSDKGMVAMGTVTFGSAAGGCNSVEGNVGVCSTQESFSSQLSTSFFDPLTSVGEVGDTPISYDSDRNGYGVTLSVDGCAENCLYVNPNHAISPNSSKAALTLTFRPSVSAFGANIYSTGESQDGDQTLPGTWTIDCGVFTETRTALDSTEFIGFFVDKEISSCTITSNNNLYVTVDNMVTGRTANCVRRNGGRRCTNRDEFERLLVASHRDNFDSLQDPSTSNDQVNSKGAGMGVSIRVEDRPDGLYFVGQSAVSLYNTGYTMTLRFSGPKMRGVRAIGANIYTVDVTDSVIPSRWSLVCGDEVESHTSYTEGNFVGIISPRDLDECYLIAHHYYRYATIDNIVFGFPAPCVVDEDKGITTCEERPAFLDLVTVNAQSSFDLAGEVGSKPTRVTVSEAGLTATIDVLDCLENCLYVNPNKAISTNKKTDALVITFAAGVRAFGARIFSTGEEEDGDEVMPGGWKLECGTAAQALSTNDDNTFIGIVSPDDIDWCRVSSSSDLYITIDDIVFGYDLPCSDIGPGVRQCTREKDFRDRLTLDTFEAFGAAGIPGDKLANLKTEGDGFTVEYTVPDCESDCLYVNPNNAISPNITGVPLVITFAGGVNSFGARIYTTGEAEDGDKVIPAAWTLTCGETVVRRMVYRDSEYFAIQIFPSITSCTLVSESELYVTIDDVTVGFESA